MEPAASELAPHLRIGSPAEMADAHTRSHLADGRVVGWYGDPAALIDAEIVAAEVPPELAARFGTDRFWERWTATECAVKREDDSMLRWMGTRGLDWSPYAVTWVYDAPAPGLVVAVLLR